LSDASRAAAVGEQADALHVVVELSAGEGFHDGGERSSPSVAFGASRDF
jgi:hypothetical protein